MISPVNVQDSQMVSYWHMSIWMDSSSPWYMAISEASWQGGMISQGGRPIDFPTDKHKTLRIETSAMHLTRIFWSVIFVSQILRCRQRLIQLRRLSVQEDSQREFDPGFHSSRPERSWTSNLEATARISSSK